MDRTLTSRFEYKYVVPESQVDLMRHHMLPFLRLDPYSERAERNRYEVSSLYLDNADLRLYRTTVNGLKNRFKLRMRTYVDSPDAPIFLEVKRRISDVILKTRAEVSRPIAMAIIGGNLPLDTGLGSETIEKMDTFADEVRRTAARPIIRVRYLREAYESRGSEPVRITFDYRLSHAVTPRVDFGHNGPDWHSTPMGGVIVEIKFTDRFPAWIHKMTGLFEMLRIPVPKYILCVDEARRRGTLDSVLPLIQPMV